MSGNSERFVVVVITQDETRIWTSKLEHGAKPSIVKDRDPFTRHKHVRMAQHHRGHDVDKFTDEYFEAISDGLNEAGEVLLITHGQGKGSAVPAFTDYLGKKDPLLAKKVADVLDVDITGLTEPQLLALAREWWEKKYGIHAVI